MFHCDQTPRALERFELSVGLSCTRTAARSTRDYALLSASFCEKQETGSLEGVGGLVMQRRLVRHPAITADCKGCIPTTSWSLGCVRDAGLNVGVNMYMRATPCCSLLTHMTPSLPCEPKSGPALHVCCAQAIEAAAAANDACVNENAHLRKQLEACPGSPMDPDSPGSTFQLPPRVYKLCRAFASPSSASTARCLADAAGVQSG